MREKNLRVAELILDAVCDYFKIAKDSVLSSSKHITSSEVRHLSMWFVKNYTSMTAYDNAQFHNRASHTIITHANYVTSNRLDVDSTFRTKVKAITSNIDQAIKDIYAEVDPQPVQQVISVV